MRSVSRGSALKADSVITGLKCFDDVHERLLSGWSVPTVAKYIREDCHELTSMTEQSVCLLLYKYRKAIPPGEFLQKAEEVMPKAVTRIHKAAEERMTNGLNELEELERLYKLQLDRIRKGMLDEKEAEKLFPSLNQEFRIAKDLLESSATLKMDLGLAKRHLGTLEAQTRVVEDVGQRYGSDAVARVINNPESRQRLGSVAQRLLLAGTSAALLSNVLNSVVGAEGEPEPVVIDAETAPPVELPPEPDGEPSLESETLEPTPAPEQE